MLKIKYLTLFKPEIWKKKAGIFNKVEKKELCSIFFAT